MSFRRIVANLDFERTIAPGEGRPVRPLRPDAARTATLLGTLMRVFGVAGDRLWLPGALPPHRVADVEGITTPPFESGELRQLEPAMGWLAWGETEAVAAMRSRDHGDPLHGDDPSSSPLWMRVWNLPRSMPAVSRHVHHRHTHTVLARELGLDLPGQRWIDSVETLEEHLAAGGAETSPGERWILKPPFSAAGRDWVRAEGHTLLPAIRSQIERTLEEGGSFLFEPLLERIRDIGITLSISDYGVEVIGRHELETGTSGRFRAVHIRGAASEEPEDRFPGDAVKAALRIGERLIALGFRGPCGIDSWLAKTADGKHHAQLFGEINARLTFGWLAQAWRDRLAQLGRIDPEGDLSLQTSTEKAPPRDSIPLVTPGEHDPLAAWLEFS